MFLEHQSGTLTFNYNTPTAQQLFFLLLLFVELCLPQFRQHVFLSIHPIVGKAFLKKTKMPVLWWHERNNQEDSSSGDHERLHETSQMGQSDIF